MPESAYDQFVKELGLPVKTGKVVASKGKYYLAIGRTQKEIPAALAGETELAKMAGKEVVALTSGRDVVAIVWPGTKRPWKPQCFRCYLPVPDFRKQLDPELEKALIAKQVETGVLTSAQAKVLAQIRTAAR